MADKDNMQVNRQELQEFSYFNLWPTNVLVRLTKLSEETNKEISAIATDFYNHHFNKKSAFPHRADTACLFSSNNSPAMAQLLNVIEETAYIYLSTFYPEIDLPATKLLFSSFSNIQNKKTKWVNPHSHVESQFVITYYSDVTFGPNEELENMPGALSIQDHRPLMANWMMRKEHKMLTLELRTGTLVVFPGYVRHATYPFFDETSSKIAIVTNVRLRDRQDIYDGVVRTADEIRALRGSLKRENTETADVR